MNKIECATCHKHLGGPAEAPATRISHGICIDCLKKQSPGAYFFGRRRALQDRLAALRADTDDQKNRLAISGVRA